MKSLKKTLRRSTIKSIDLLDPASRVEQENRILKRISELPSYRSAQTVLLYIRAFPEEIDVSSLIQRVLESSKRLICPRVDRQARELTLHEIRDLQTDLEPGTLGIPEPRVGSRVIAPSEVDWVLVPGVAFDVRCNRLGRGGGHYDRLLPRIRANVETWAIAFDCQVYDELPLEPHDIMLYGIATASRDFVRSSD